MTLRLLAAVLVGVMLGLGGAGLGMHYRQPIPTTVPIPFDPDLVTLQIRQAPKDADIVFLGDSLTERWRFRPELWAKFGKAANLGIGGMRTANLLWLVESGRLSTFHPKYFVVMIGTNDIQTGQPGFFERRRPSTDDVTRGQDEIAKVILEKFPDSKVLTVKPPQIDHFFFPYEMAEDGLHLGDAGYEKLSLMIHLDVP